MAIQCLRETLMHQTDALIIVENALRVKASGYGAAIPNIEPAKASRLWWSVKVVPEVCHPEPQAKDPCVAGAYPSLRSGSQIPGTSFTAH
jgi:hypothetical protein